MFDHKLFQAATRAGKQHGYGEQPETLLKGVGKAANRGSEASIPAALSLSGGPGTARHIPKDVRSQSKWVGKRKEEQA